MGFFVSIRTGFGFSGAGFGWSGTILAGKYRVEAVIGRGGMGVVVRAVQEPIGRRVAVKLSSEGARVASSGPF